MNELIKELAERAAVETFDQANELSLEVSCEDQSYQVPSSFIIRLSELIVQECATLAYDGPGGILEHFGVEEPPVDNVDRILRTVRTRGTKE